MYFFMIPLSWLYGVVVGLRNLLFDLRVLPSERFGIPVISIGNIIAGGTGKTPHTEFLIRVLSGKYRVAVLSRGYGRRSHGFVIAGECSDCRSLGDEPYQIYRKFPGITVAVDANRRRGIRRLLALPDDRRPEVILLDDAFQHRYVRPSLSILLTDYSRPLHGDCLLPAGRLRENASGIKRADIVVVTKCPKDVCRHGSRLYSSFRYKNLLPVFPDFNTVTEESLERLKKENYSLMLVAGLANPAPMLDYLKDFTTDLQTVFYPDHHCFTKKDLERIESGFNKIENRNRLIITSEKDAARLVDNPFVADCLKQYIFELPIEVVFNCPEQEKLFIQKIESHVTEFERNSCMVEAADS